MHTRYGLKLWSSEDWREQAVSWLDERLSAAGIRRTGEVTQPHLQPWGTVLKAPTTRGPFWLKAPGPETAFEIELYQLFLRVAPDWVLTPVAADQERGWLVLPDGGAVLGDRIDEIDLTAELAEILPEYGRLQRDLSPHVDDLVSFGVTDMRAAAMPKRFEEALDAVGQYLSQYGDPAGWEVHRRATELRGTFGSWCERLAGAVVPASIDHNDLHPWNIFVPGASGTPDAGKAKFYDWGDSVVAHPFASMLVALGFVGQYFGLGADDPGVLRARDAYLEVFTDLAPHTELVEELELACRVAKVARVLTWDRSLQAQGYEEAGGFATAPLQCLAALLADSWFEVGM
ncbi:phosphotransferase [Amycolatopsis nigrescens]|uniref:phosphotransferase n=1 Tax=Amycolatopsis nigrescens TaxID=381445 RepID=UPI0003717977|nr:phosphotransferase [Amycolatopsis nigrescens]